MNNDVTVIFSIQYCLKLYWNTSVHGSHQTYSKAYRYKNICGLLVKAKTAWYGYGNIRLYFACSCTLLYCTILAFVRIHTYGTHSITDPTVPDSINRKCALGFWLSSRELYHLCPVC